VFPSPSFPKISQNFRLLSPTPCKLVFFSYLDSFLLSAALFFLCNTVTIYQVYVFPSFFFFPLFHRQKFIHHRTSLLRNRGNRLQLLLGIETSLPVSLETKQNVHLTLPTAGLHFPPCIPRVSPFLLTSHLFPFKNQFPPPLFFLADPRVFHKLQSIFASSFFPPSFSCVYDGPPRYSIYVLPVPFFPGPQIDFSGVQPFFPPQFNMA